MLMSVLKCTRSFKFINGSHHILASLVWLYTRTVREKYLRSLSLPFSMNLFAFSSFLSAVYISIAYLTTNTVVAHNEYCWWPITFVLFIFSSSSFSFSFLFLLLLFPSFTIVKLSTGVILKRYFSIAQRTHIHLQIQSCVDRCIMPCCFYGTYCLYALCLCVWECIFKTGNTSQLQEYLESVAAARTVVAILNNNALNENVQYIR